MLDGQELVTVSELADRLGVCASSVRSVLSRHKDEFPDASYPRRRWHPRRHRVLSPEEQRRIMEIMGFLHPVK